MTLPVDSASTRAEETDPYAPPTAAAREVPSAPSALAVAGRILLVSGALAIAYWIVEALSGRAPGRQAASFIAPLVSGISIASGTGVMLSRSTRAKATLWVFAAWLAIAPAIVWLSIESGTSFGSFASVVTPAIALVSVIAAPVTYFGLWCGERIGIRSFEKARARASTESAPRAEPR